MATVKLNNVILAVARKLKDSRTLATDNGTRYTSALLTEYVNRSVRDFLIESYQKFGEKTFTELFPDYVVTGGDIVVSALGVGARPTDCFTILSLMQKTTLLKFWKVSQKQVQDLVSGLDKILSPSATAPVFYEEGTNFKTLGLVSATVIPRYIKTHQDLTPVTSAAGNGNFYVSGASWVASTRTLTATMNATFTSADIGKPIMFRTASVVYFGIIESVTSIVVVVVKGDGLPTGNITPTDVLMADVAESADLTLNQYWHNEIIDRAVAQANQDAKAFAS